MKSFRSPDKRAPRLLAQGGFTVIETLIVLAAAGLILLVVLMAVPALERSSHNNQRKQDVQAVLEAVSHWELNNSGNIPTTMGGSTGALAASNTKLTFYDPPNIQIHGGSSGNPAIVAPNTNTDQINVYNYQKCATTADIPPGAAGGSVAIGSGYSDVVALYAIETASGTTGKCQQL